MKPNSLFKPLLAGSLMILMIQQADLYSQNKHDFRFRENHIFKIAQFTDIHWDNTSVNCSRTDSTIRMVLESEKPDLAVLTGDVVTAAPAREGWLAVSKIFIDEKVPWAVTLGNHDGEPGITRDEIFNLLSPMPYFAGSKGPGLYGCGNYSIPVKSSDGKPVAAVIYCMDSNDYPKDRKSGTYDWIHFDQIGWYRNTSDKYTKANNGSPVPSVVFFHIPLVEFRNVVGKMATTGIKNEGVSSSDINSGLLASLVEKKDVMGVFVGHDHDNDYIGIDHDIALSFGQVTGADAYGNLERGSRIIELHEGEFSFDTWIRTKSGVTFRYNYPSGLAVDDTDIEYLPSKDVNDLKPGLKYDYYEGRFKSTSQIEYAGILKTGTLKNISLEPAAVKDSFALVFHAWIKIPVKSVYRFYIYSDDGSSLFIDGKEVVNNDGSHGAKRADGKIALDAGYHEFQLLYFQDYMGKELETGISSIKIRECRIPDNFFFTR
jgi:3',5'-cyclic AMP phosphodiesterase CpdA